MTPREILVSFNISDDMTNKYLLVACYSLALNLCVVPFQGEEVCGDLIEAHKACMRALGFKI